MNTKGLKGELNPAWKGDKVGYIGIHAWVSKQLGKPDKCEHCEKFGLTGHKIGWANKSGQYKRDLNDWIRLCRKCHCKFDRVSERMSVIRKDQETLRFLKNYYLGKRTRPTYVHEKRYRYKFS